MSKDPDAKKGAVAQDRPGQKSNESMAGQYPHGDQGKILQGQDSDFPEPGENEEHSMEGKTQKSRFGGDPAENVERSSKEQSPGERQKRNQNDRREDPLAS